MPGQRTGTFVVTALVLAAMQTYAGQQLQIKPAVPVDPIPAIVDAFQSHRVVAILISLVRDPPLQCCRQRHRRGVWKRAVPGRHGSIRPWRGRPIRRASPRMAGRDAAERGQ
jgi:hypothetical protein